MEKLQQRTEDLAEQKWFGDKQMQQQLYQELIRFVLEVKEEPYRQPAAPYVEQLKQILLKLRQS